MDISVRLAGLVASGIYGETDTMAIRTREKMQRKTLVCAEDLTLALPYFDADGACVRAHTRESRRSLCLSVFAL